VATNYTISGQVTVSGGGLSGVTMTLSGSQTNSSITNASGNYSFTVAASANYTVTPSLNGYTFSPPSQGFSNLSASQTANFMANPVATIYTISGQVTLLGSLNGTTMTLSGSQSASTTTNTSGDYSFTLTAGGSYTVTPSRAGYVFTPPTQTFNNLSGNQTANFSGTGETIGLTAAGSIAQLVSGGGQWATTITLVNLGTTPAQAALNFFDNNGNALPLALIFPQGTLSPTTTATLTSTLNPSSGLVIATAGLNNLLSVGWAQLLSNGNVGGFAVFTDTVTSQQQQQAVVPLQVPNSGPYVLWFDNTNGFSTGVAIANLTTQPANITVVIRDDTGAELSTQPITLPALGHVSFNLPSSATWPAGATFAMTQNIRGTLEFNTTAAGQISVIGLSFNPASAFTSIPALLQ
jgi:hypothetical protein